MELVRKITEQLLAWKAESQGKKALLIWGARRVGKSTSALRFAERAYKSYILIDFSIAPKRIIQNFENLHQLDIFFQNLSLEYNTKLYKRESLIIFDEIQKCPKAREAIKHLVADRRYDYLETGSLISIQENVENIVIPSEERKIMMYPLDFEEFAWARGEHILLDYIQECYFQHRPLEEAMHKRAMRIFKEYMLVGGLPQSVVAYLENDLDFSCSDREKRDILNLYRDDIQKAAQRYRSRVSVLFEHIPSFLSTHEKRVVVSRLANGSVYSQFDEPIFWLENSMIVNTCYKCNDPNIGFSLNKNTSSVKCYLADTGLLFSLTFSENEIDKNQLYKEIMYDKLSINKGMFYENCISQILTAFGHKLFFYTRFNQEKHRNDIEIDFLISNKSRTNFSIFPIEVKSSKNYSKISLDKFREIFQKRIGFSYIIHPKNFVEEENIARIPPYMLFCLLKNSIS